MLSFATPTANAMLQKLVDRLGASGGPGVLQLYYFVGSAGSFGPLPIHADMPVNYRYAATHTGDFTLSNPVGTVANKALTFTGVTTPVMSYEEPMLGRFVDKNGNVLLQGYASPSNSDPQAFYNIGYGLNGVAASYLFTGEKVTLP